MGNSAPMASRDMLGTDRGATLRRAPYHLRRSTGRSRGRHNTASHIALDQRVVSFLAQHHGKLFCDSCLAVALGVLEQHAVQHITDDLAVRGTHSRSRGDCLDCRRHKIVTTAL